MSNIIYNVATKVANQLITLPVSPNIFINALRDKERNEDIGTYHPFVPQSKLLKGLIKPTQN